MPLSEHKRQSGGHLDTYKRDPIDCRDLYGHTPAVLIFTPIFLPIATGQLGMDPVHFGIMMVLNLCVGLCTPPVGSVLFIGCSVAGTKIDQVIRPLLPMFAAMVIVLFLVAFLPDLSLLIPRLFGL